MGETYECDREFERKRQTTFATVPMRKTCHKTVIGWVGGVGDRGVWVGSGGRGAGVRGVGVGGLGCMSHLLCGKSSLWRIFCGESSMWRILWQPLLRLIVTSYQLINQLI